MARVWIRDRDGVEEQVGDLRIKTYSHAGPFAGIGEALVWLDRFTGSQTGLAADKVSERWEIHHYDGDR